MKNAFTTNITLIISILLSVSLFSCQQEYEGVVPAKKFKKQMNGTWTMESVVSDTTTETPLFTHLEFDKDGFFNAFNGTTIVTSGEYAVGENVKELQMLALATEERELLSYWVKDYTGERIGLIPVEDGPSGEVFYYEKQ